MGQTTSSASQFHFSSLTPDLMLDAIESVGCIADSGLLALNSYENRVYQFIARDEQRYVVKFYRPERWHDAQIDEEHQFALALQAAEVPVIAPIVMDGQTLFHYQGHRFSLFPSVGGRAFDGSDFDQLTRIGEQLGRLHQVGRACAFEYRPSIDLQMLDNAVRVLKAQADIPAHIQGAFFSVVDRLIPLIERAFQTNSHIEMLRVHGDAHAGNLLIRDELLHFVDLDDARNGPAIQDLWMFLSGDRANQLAQLDALLEGYELFSAFNRAELALIEPLRALRMLHYMAWLVQRWDDPAFPRNFSWFNTVRYWESQVLVLKEQLATLDEPPLQLF